MSLMVSISGIRGIVGETLTPSTIIKYISAFAQYCNYKTIIIGRDGRITGESIANIVSAALTQSGCTVINLGICPTPTVQLAVEHFHAAGGISITASHNPMQWNGMKFIASTGMFLNAEENKIFWNIAEKENPHYTSWEKQGKLTNDNTMIEQHIRAVEKLPFINLKKIQQRKFKIVVDCVNAAGGIIVPKLLRYFGCEVIELHCNNSGIFPHTPEPLPENLTELAQHVVQEKADFGIAVDPDVDRLVLITEKGEPLGEEYTIASIVQYMLETEKKLGKENHTVVINLSTTRAVEDIAQKYNAKILRTPVGEINVAKKMKEVKALVGGEGSGGIILPAVHLGRDAIVGIGIFLQLLTDFHGTLSEYKSTLPFYVIVKNKIELGSLQPDTLLKKLENDYKKTEKVNIEDGLRIDFEKSWVHLRKSNTEPIIRIIAEATTKEQAEKLVEKFRDKIVKI